MTQRSEPPHNPDASEVGTLSEPMNADNPRHLIDLLSQRRADIELRNTDIDDWGESLCISPGHLLDTLGFLQADPDADLEILVDIICVDHFIEQSCDDPSRPEDASPDMPQQNDDRFEVIYLLRSVRLPYQLSVRVFTSREHPQVPSVTSLYPSADWLERELYELFGVYADGHPHLRGLLLYPDFVSHPMRRDYPRGKAQPMVPLRPPASPPVVIDDSGDNEDVQRPPEST